MTVLSNLEVSSTNNKRSLEKLVRAVTLSEGQFSVILVRCNDIRLRDKIMKQLQEHSSVEIQIIKLSPSITTLYTAIKTTLGDKQPEALMVLGLESVVAIEQVLTATNIMRDEFRKQFPFPLVLWVSDDILGKVIRLAPDFKSWAANAILFDTLNNLDGDRSPIESCSKQAYMRFSH